MFIIDTGNFSSSCAFKPLQSCALPIDSSHAFPQTITCASLHPYLPQTYSRSLSQSTPTLGGDTSYSTSQFDVKEMDISISIHYMHSQKPNCALDKIKPGMTKRGNGYETRVSPKTCPLLATSTSNPPPKRRNQDGFNHHRYHRLSAFMNLKEHINRS